MNYGSHPINLAFRFILEMATLFVVAYWGWTEFTAWPRFLLAFGLPILLAVTWGGFCCSQRSKPIRENSGCYSRLDSLAY